MSAARPKRLDPARYGRQPWKNGGGVTIDIAGEGGENGWADVVWRYGRTSILTPAPFSDLTGFERLQIVIRGRGLVLVTPDGEIDLREPFRPARYDGGTPIVSKLENGTVEVVNLIGDRARCRIDLRVGVAGERYPAPAGIHIVHAAGGPGSLRVGRTDHPLQEDHALRFDLDAEAEFLVASGRLTIASIYPLQREVPVPGQARNP